ncbi:MAG: EamA family transporter [Eisenbergiella massiliensis]
MLGLLLVTIIWGAGFTASDIALQSLEPFQIMAGRFLLAALLMGAAGFPGLRKSPGRSGRREQGWECFCLPPSPFRRWGCVIPHPLKMPFLPRQMWFLSPL